MSFENLERYLPEYLQNDIQALIEGERNKVRHLDCLLDEVYGSINSAYYGNQISWEEAEYLRDKYLR